LPLICGDGYHALVRCVHLVEQAIGVRCRSRLAPGLAFDLVESGPFSSLADRAGGSLDATCDERDAKAAARSAPPFAAS